MANDEIRLQFDSSEALISVIGSSLLSLTLENSEVIPAPASPRHPYHGVMLAPWPNRIAGGKYTFEGRNYQSEVNESFGNALHGLLVSAKASVDTKTENFLKLVSKIQASDSYPWNLTVSISFTLDADGLRVETVATNDSMTDAPVGLGTHPFFVFDEQSTLEVRAKSASVHGDNMMPISEIDASSIGFGMNQLKQIESVSLDVQFTNLEPVCAILRTRDWTLEIWQERANWLMVYTTEEFNWLDGRVRAVAIEPQTCAADAFNNSQGLKSLAPGESFGYVWGARKTSAN